MKQNIGKIDKIIRIVLALIAFGLGYMFHTWWGLFGLIPLLTALVGNCPLYPLFGMNTCKTKK